MGQKITDIFKEHECGGCKRAGKCAIEPIVKYVAKFPGKAEKVGDKFTEMLSGAWFDSVMDTAMVSDENGYSATRTIQLIVMISFFAGVMSADGFNADIKDKKPDKSDMISVLKSLFGDRLVVVNVDDDMANAKATLDKMFKDTEKKKEG